MKLLIAGGGTGGHLFPGVAIAEELRARDPEAPVLFVGTERGIEARVLPGLGWDLELIEVSGLKTVGLWGKVKGLFRIPGALWQSRKVLKKFRPDVVIGVGGYASGPVVLMARLRGIKTAVIEQNSIPGLTNKILGKVVRRIFIAFDETRKFFKAKKTVLAGNPIRAQIRDALTGAQRPARDPGAPMRLFVFGGSQGAMAVNKLVTEAAALLAERDVPVDIVHQVGKRDFDDAVARYAQAGITADVRAFIDDMASEYAKADLVVSRAGATTVAELGVVGVPALLIPYPYAADNHQEINAREMADAGAAKMMLESDLTGETLADAIAECAAKPQLLADMRSAMNALGRPDAASTIVDWCEQND